MIKFKKVFDCFLINDEINLLEIRLNYLDSFVDKFIITEFCQTHQGKLKSFNFQNNINRFKKFKKKIIYIKNYDFFENLNQLKKYIRTKKTFKNFYSKKNFDKFNFAQILETYQRYWYNNKLSNILNLEDHVIFSDIDEIPKLEIINKILNYNNKKNYINLCLQDEYRYFPNYLFRKNWPGSIIGKWKHFKNDTIQAKIFAKSSKEVRRKFFQIHKNAGYHFSYMDNVKKLEGKLRSTSHSEITNFSMKHLDRHVYSGHDISLYVGKPKGSKIISNNSYKFIDKKLYKLILEKFNDYNFEFRKLSYHNSLLANFFNILMRLKKFNPLKFIK